MVGEGEIRSEGSSGPGVGSQESRLNPVKVWWHTRVQGDLAAFFIVLAGFDLTPYADDIAELFPRIKHIKPLIRIAGGIAIYWRARQVRRTNDPDADPARRLP